MRAKSLAVAVFIPTVAMLLSGCPSSALINHTDITQKTYKTALDPIAAEIADIGRLRIREAMEWNPGTPAEKDVWQKKVLELACLPYHDEKYIDFLFAYQTMSLHQQHLEAFSKAPDDDFVSIINAVRGKDSDHSAMDDSEFRSQREDSNKKCLTFMAAAISPAGADVDRAMGIQSIDVGKVADLLKAILTAVEREKRADALQQYILHTHARMEMARKKLNNEMNKSLLVKAGISLKFAAAELDNACQDSNGQATCKKDAVSTARSLQSMAKHLADVDPLFVMFNDSEKLSADLTNLERDQKRLAENDLTAGEYGKSLWAAYQTAKDLKEKYEAFNAARQ